MVSHNDLEMKEQLKSCSRRMFVQRAALLGGMVALGPGSYLYCPNRSWGADPIKVGIATDLTGPSVARASRTPMSLRW